MGKKPRTLGKVQKIKDLEGVGHPVMYLVGDDAHAEARLLHGSLHPPLVQPGVIHLNTAARGGQMTAFPPIKGQLTTFPLEL